jgi:hypothetical protein
VSERDLFGDVIPTPYQDPEWFGGGTPTQRINVRKGLHPMGAPLLEQRNTCATCGDCKHLFRFRPTPSPKTYLKCRMGTVTRGPGSDIRRKWAACVAFQSNPKE